jgi:pimeloyl-ACP methyl ester carboxylesterase
MHVFHFGHAEKRLFGVYHPPANEMASQVRGIVLCQPFGHEYIRSHRALRTLAQKLSDTGCHTLRFDYYGCGDSMGSGDEATLEQSTRDIATAIDELKDMAGVLRVSLVGVRLGATLAAMSALKRKDVERLVLWDPVISGRMYLTELRALQAEWLNARPYMSHEESSEIIGFPLSETLEGEIAAIDLLDVSRWPGKQTAILASEGIDVAPLCQHLERIRASFAVEQVPSSCDWRRPSVVHKLLIAPDMTQKVLSAFDSRVIA